MTKKPVPKKKSGGQADGVRGSLWYFLPEELTVVGHDTNETEHELCDAQSNAFSAETYTEYINYMRLNGIDKPILFRREAGTDRKLVIEGRTTVRVARVVAALWEQDRKAEGLKGDDAKLRIPAVVRRGTADELFCTMHATNRRRPGSDDAMHDAKAMARLVNGGATEEQAATRLGIPVERGKKLLAVLKLHPKAQRQVGAGLSLDAAAKLAKLPELEQVKRLAEIQATGEKPTARAVTNKLREGSGKAPVETPAQKLKKIAEALRAHDDNPSEEANELAQAFVEQVRQIISPRQYAGAARRGLEPAEQEAEFGA